MTAPVSISDVSNALLNLFELTDAKSKAGNSLVESLVSSFAGGADGDAPAKGVLGSLSALSTAPTAGTAATTTTPPPRFDASDLYGVSGRPREADIQQDSVGDCYFVAVLGAVGERTPDRIKNAISYDASTGTFNVKLYTNEFTWNPPGFKQVTIPVTQQDILDNLTRRGGSIVDNNAGTDSPIWPAVMETAFAKMNDGNWSDGLAQGYKAIDGGWARDAMLAITGKPADELRGMGLFDTETQAEILFMQVREAIADGRPVTLSTDPEARTLAEIIQNKPGAQDGLVDDHVYMVDRVYKNSAGEVMVELRNPWGNNNNVGEGRDTANATISVKLETLLETKGIDCFTVGPRA